jgi:hypothetical protein
LLVDAAFAYQRQRLAEQLDHRGDQKITVQLREICRLPACSDM